MDKNDSQKKKTKYKLKVMDIITIVFTAVILGIMIFVLYDQFAGDESNNGANNNNTAVATGTTTSTPSPTSEPTLSDIGNIYGNITNDADVAVIDEREYFISTDENGDKHIWASIGDTTKDIIKTEASSLNVVTDYISYADQTDVTAYYVFYINGDGKICYVYDGPLGSNLEEKENLEEQLFLNGSFKSIDVSGEYVYYLTTDGQIGRVNILTKETAQLSQEHKYDSFVLYYGAIYGLCSEDGKIYAMSSTPASTEETATASPTPTDSEDTEEDPNEILVISEASKNFVLDDYWIYVITDNGIARYICDQTDKKDTLINVNVDALNVYQGAMFYIADGDLYTASAEILLTGAADKIGSAIGADSINIFEDSIYLTDKSGKLMKSTYDSESDSYSEFIAMN